jgi:hypothetical protein
MDQPNVIMNEPPKQGGGWLKWALIGCGGLLLIAAIVIGIGLYWVSRNMSIDPTQVEAAAQEILQFEKPAGYQGVMSMSMMGMKVAMLASPSGPNGGVIMLMALPAGIANTEDVQRQMRETMRQQGRGFQDVTEQRPSEMFTVRGEPVEAQVGAGGGDGAEKHIQYTLTAKNAANAPVLVLVGGPESMVTHEWVQDFLDTVK